MIRIKRKSAHKKTKIHDIIIGNHCIDRNDIKNNATWSQKRRQSIEASLLGA